MTKKEMPDRIWVWELHNNMGSSRGWNEKSGWNSVEYRRADLPPTLAEAMRCPEVKALVEALHYYADFHENPNDGPWGLASDDYGKVAREALIKL